MHRLLPASLLFVTLLVGCGSDQVVLPTGPQTLSGTLMPADISMSRRGTHVLTLPDQARIYVESPVVNLRRYSGRTVTVLGVFELNIDPALPPILVVQEVLQAEDLTRDWTSDDLGISLSLPSSWGVSASDARAVFLPPGSLEPVLVIETNSDPLPPGTPIVVDQRRAVRIVDPISGRQTIFVDRGTDRLVLSFIPDGYADQETLRTEWLSLLQTIDLREAPRTVNTPVSGTGTVGGSACGGSAGVLCPAGQYCEITDTANNIGECKPI